MHVISIKKRNFANSNRCAVMRRLFVCIKNTWNNYHFQHNMNLDILTAVSPIDASVSLVLTLAARDCKCHLGICPPRTPPVPQCMGLRQQCGQVLALLAAPCPSQGLCQVGSGVAAFSPPCQGHRRRGLVLSAPLLARDPVMALHGGDPGADMHSGPEPTGLGLLMTS